MSDLILPIEPATPVDFIATEALIRVIGGDPVADTSDVYFEISRIPSDPVTDPPNDNLIAGGGTFKIMGNATVKTSWLNNAADAGVLTGRAVAEIMKQIIK